jgi:predicted permease
MSKQLAVDVGFRSDRIAIAPLNLERIGFNSSNALPQLVEIVRRISLVPGVERVGISRSEPLAGTESSQGIPELEGYKSSDGNPVMVNFADVGPDTFAALGIPILYGREINPTDVNLGRKVIVVNESFVNQFWSGQEPLGKHIQQNEVIGVVKDVRFNRLDSPPRPMMFPPLRSEFLLHAKLLVQAKGDPRRLIFAVRKELVRVHPKVMQGEVCTLRDTMKNALAVQLGALRILSTLGGLALALSVIGTYGVMSYIVARRTREIGVRLALGATRADVMKLILTVGFRLGLMALVIGLPVSLSAAGLLRHYLAGISPFDPLSFVTVAVCVFIALITACWLPTRRATRVDPMEALRYE